MIDLTLLLEYFTVVMTFQNIVVCKLRSVFAVLKFISDFKAWFRQSTFFS